jgi:hypothetical protein
VVSGGDEARLTPSRQLDHSDVIRRARAPGVGGLSSGASPHLTDLPSTQTPIVIRPDQRRRPMSDLRTSSARLMPPAARASARCVARPGVCRRTPDRHAERVDGAAVTRAPRRAPSRRLKSDAPLLPPSDGDGRRQQCGPWFRSRRADGAVLTRGATVSFAGSASDAEMAISSTSRHKLGSASAFRIADKLARDSRGCVDVGLLSGRMRPPGRVTDRAG